ncbi:hydrophobic protein [Streptomyces tateyamensis]|uniref:Hydrophobic protein n=1 Tax=Streptomyces tateyamensis TaxID=565073 RepID=A0A2V4N8L3_9ACTN|nr:hydrophobic protein [Streptomyces tateyamensis]PYC74538.1 hydrophobic protein [Streptomyces tateyamensis]
MGALLLVLLLAVILAGVGFAIHLLWWVAVVVFVLWLLGFVFRGAGAGGSRGRWYRW